jgi:hypothetical protein
VSYLGVVGFPEQDYSTTGMFHMEEDAELLPRRHLGKWRFWSQIYFDGHPESREGEKEYKDGLKGRSSGHEG